MAPILNRPSYFESQESSSADIQNHDQRTRSLNPTDSGNQGHGFRSQHRTSQLAADEKRATSTSCRNRFCETPGPHFTAHCKGKVEEEGVYAGYIHACLRCQAWFRHTTDRCPLLKPLPRPVRDFFILERVFGKTRLGSLCV